MTNDTKQNTIDITPSWAEWAMIYARFAEGGERTVCKGLRPDLERMGCLADTAASAARVKPMQVDGVIYTYDEDGRIMPFDSVTDEIRRHIGEESYHGAWVSQDTAIMQCLRGAINFYNCRVTTHAIDKDYVFTIPHVNPDTGETIQVVAGAVHAYTPTQGSDITLYEYVLHDVQ